ncbi:MAG: ABC transporter permease [Bacteroidia bacterium]
MSESVTLSIVGGLVGGLGVGLSLIIRKQFEVPAVISWMPILLSFFVAFTVGVTFGLFPALKAARQDPVISLRHD